MPRHYTTWLVDFDGDQELDRRIQAFWEHHHGNRTYLSLEQALSLRLRRSVAPHSRNFPEERLEAKFKIDSFKSEQVDGKLYLRLEGCFIPADEAVIYKATVKIYAFALSNLTEQITVELQGQLP